MLSIEKFQEHYRCEFVAGECLVIVGRGCKKISVGRMHNGVFHYNIKGREMVMDLERAHEEAKAAAARELSEVEEVSEPVVEKARSAPAKKRRSKRVSAGVSIPEPAKGLEGINLADFEDI